MSMATQNMIGVGFAMPIFNIAYAQVNVKQNSYFITQMKLSSQVEQLHSV